jgi:hypothetical protein
MIHRTLLRCSECGTEWDDEWDCLCNDRCPTCNAETTPESAEAVSEPLPSDLQSLAREVLACVDRYGHPQTQTGGTAEYDVLVPIPASVIRALRASVEHTP